MQLIESVGEMSAYAGGVRDRGRKIALVPTMGYLHEGHLSLMREGRRRGDCLVVSIYVNPTQFGAGEDLEKYPRDLARDMKMAETAGVDVVFHPSSSDMYPGHYQTYVNLEEVTQNLCGLSRPGHFRGVATVCCKLFNIVKPHAAIFGRKDFQQLVVIKRMVADLNMDLEIIGMPTVRENDGLAMSSRNVYLREEERRAARKLSRSLVLAQQVYDDGQRGAPEVLKAVREFISEDRLVSLEYAKICDAGTIADVDRLADGVLLALAARVGKTRLIDNHIFGEPLSIED